MDKFVENVDESGKKVYGRLGGKGGIGCIRKRISLGAYLLKMTAENLQSVMKKKA